MKVIMSLELYFLLWMDGLSRGVSRTATQQHGVRPGFPLRPGFRTQAHECIEIQIHEYTPGEVMHD